MTRQFFAPTIKIVLLFCLLGPAVGGALFLPLALMFKPPAEVNAIALLIVGAALGHVVGLILAYGVGLGPAAATGFLYALWDAAAPERAPRAAVASLIGGLMAYGLLLRLASLGASAELTVDSNAGLSTAHWTGVAFWGGVGSTLREAFVAAGAAAGLVCALAASLLGLTMRSGTSPFGPPAAPREGL